MRKAVHRESSGDGEGCSVDINTWEPQGMTLIDMQMMVIPLWFYLSNPSLSSMFVCLYQVTKLSKANAKIPYRTMLHFRNTARGKTRGNVLVLVTYHDTNDI